MIDFHSHILPALDDGAIAVDDSIAMARSLADFGYKVVCCTPHCLKGYYDLRPQQVREATLMLQADLDNAEIKLELWPGMEYMLDECFAEYADDLLPIGETKLVLCEAPPQANSDCVREGLELIIEKGFIPLVAHPERTRLFYKGLMKRKAQDEQDKDDLKAGGIDPYSQFEKRESILQKLFAPFSSKNKIKSKNQNTMKFKDDKIFELLGQVLYQANMGSFTGFYGEKVQRNAYELLKNGVYTALATDLHDTHSARGILMRDKFDNNPLLKRLAEFDGDTTGLLEQQKGAGENSQGELF